MTSPVTASSRRHLAPALVLLLLGLVAMGGALRNDWVQDDPPLVLGNERVHEWSGLWTGFVEPYWPPPSPGGLYRPLARSFLTLQWMASAGALPVFRVIDLLLYLGLVLAVWALARELLTQRQAWIAAALFAVHPVHVEAAAVAVNQGELVAAIAVCLAAVAWLRWMRGLRSTGPTIALVAALYLIALNFKEHALVLPLLLAALELVRPPGVDPEGRQRRRALGGLLALGAAWWLVRAMVVGSVAGAAPVEGLRGSGFAGRALTMLGVAGEWVRLLVWPAHLQGDYSPWEIAPWEGWQSEQTAGVAALAAFGLALALTWRRRPAAGLGLLWVMLALAPVSNLVVPTGILLAERTLLLASVGVVIAAGALVPESIWEGRRSRVAAGAALALILLLGAGRSATRMQVWRDRDRYLAALRTDAPESWRTMVGAGIAEMEAGRRAEGERLLREAGAAWPASPRPIQVLAFYHRLDGRCAAAVPLLEQALWLQPGDRWTRVPLVACLLDLGRYADARAVAVVDTAADPHGRMLRLAAAFADSAQAHGTPPHTVRLPPLPGGTTIIGPVRRSVQQ